MRTWAAAAPLQLVLVTLTVTVTALAWPAPASAKDFYVDPATGSPSGDGSAAKPWRTIEEVISANLVATQNWASLPYTSSSKLAPKNTSGPIKAGDTIYLRSGYHGALSIIGHYNAQVVTIAAQAGQTPKLKSVLVRSSSNWVLRNLSVSPEFAPTYAKATLVAVESHSWSGPAEQVTVESCTLRSVADASKWTATDWNNKACNGIQAGGKQITLRKNSLKNVDFGISVGASDSLVDNNVVENFSGDGLRGLGDNTVFSYNTVMNCYDVNANHDDGFQSWSVGSDGKVGTGTVTGVVLRGNTIINYTDPKQPLRGTLQGIGMFDGTFVNWIIENNVIITDHWHGITLLGAKGSRVVNNTVIDPNSVTPGPPWIQIGAHKDGTPPTGCTVRNNLTTALNNASSGVTEDHNIKIASLATYFVSSTFPFDLHLKPGCPAIDKGSATLAPTSDIEKTPRPQGAGIDVGAYEWHKALPKPDAAVNDAAAADAAPAGDAAQDGDAAPMPDARDPGEDPGPGVDVGAAGDGATGDGAAGDGGSRGDDGCSCRVALAGSVWSGWPPLLLLSLLLLSLLLLLRGTVRSARRKASRR